LNESEIQSIKQRFGIVGKSPELNHAIEVATQVAPTLMTVLISGESGVGKESFSKIIHQLSPRKHGQFIAINCGAIPEGTIDSELFGHEKGSFTGAHEARKGYFEVTRGGTIFLDEIGEMPNKTQSRLLRVLEYGEFIRVGSSKIVKTDVRIVAATNKDLLQAVYDRKFREDLYYRLNTVPIFVPPLRQRGSDIELLFRKFSADFSEKYRTKPLSLTPDSIDLLVRYSFPGNIRQLKNLVEQMSVLELNRTVDSSVLSKYLPQETTLPALRDTFKTNDESISERDLLYKVLFDLRNDVNELKAVVGKTDSKGKSFVEFQHQTSESLSTKQDTKERSLIVNVKEDENPYELKPVSKDYDVHDITHETEEDDSLSLEKKEKELIIKALQKNNNKRKYAARDLGISERTLYRKIKQYLIEE